jgi:hypothetical protein
MITGVVVLLQGVEANQDYQGAQCTMFANSSVDRWLSHATYVSEIQTGWSPHSERSLERRHGWIRTKTAVNSACLETVFVIF